MKNMEQMTYELVNKEEIPNFRFGKADVLTDLAARQKRRWDANRATVLGNGYHGKVEILFETNDGEPKRVDTTIWDCDQHYLILKSGASIPIRSVHSIEFY
jgi:hypothetical protein